MTLQEAIDNLQLNAMLSPKADVFCEAVSIVIIAAQRAADLQAKIDSGKLVPVVSGEWNGWTTSAFIGMDNNHDPRYSNRRFYRCTNCDHGSAVKHKYCPSCGAKMNAEQEDSHDKN